MSRCLQQKKIDPDLLLMLACYPNALLLRASSVVLTQFFFLAWNSPLSHYYPFLLAYKQISLNMPSAKMKVQRVQDTFHSVSNEPTQKN